MTNQRLRNLTTGILHTKMDDIYSDVEFVTGEKGVMTPMLPNALHAMQPWLKEKVSEARFWDGAFDVSHTGETKLEPMSEEEKQAFWKRYAALSHPFAKLS